MDRTAEIARLNDELRTSFRGGDVRMTSSVYELPDMVKAHALVALGRITNLREPEREYGTFRFCGRGWWFLIRYWNLAGEKPSPNPADPSVTRRVLTLGLDEDW